MTFLVGVAGGTGSGKTTVARSIVEGLPPDKVAILQHDHYYRDRADLSYDERAKLNFDHPDSLETSLLIEHIRALKQGASIESPIYDFKEHRRKEETRPVDPREVIVVEGILVFVDPGIRELFNLKVFVDTDADIRAFRRIRRDLEKRGRTFASIREQYYKTVRPMHMMFVEPSKRWADVIIPEGGHNRVALDVILSKLRDVVREGADVES